MTKTPEARDAECLHAARLARAHARLAAACRRVEVYKADIKRLNAERDDRDQRRVDEYAEARQ